MCCPLEIGYSWRRLKKIISNIWKLNLYNLVYDIANKMETPKVSIARIELESYITFFGETQLH